ncbi:DUF4198 domain-containing protein [Marinobacterium jannaschii]|uniref:DUF4198 domain-containing protein n=1 Tax=Marinobacterium jannaschii TaxID=64970 RepID=UPI000482EFBD|nr:DUF4198 domain-containing protein [Marinobacterium jannaschii]
MKSINFASAAVLTILATSMLSQTVSAHPVYMLPGDFSLSSDKAEWVSVDVSASHTVFSADKGIGLQDLKIISPDGHSSRIGSYFKGQRRSVFDLELQQEGTYKLKIQGKPGVMTFYKIGKRGTEKRGFFDKIEARTQLPKGAYDAESIRFSRQSLSFVTRKAPSRGALTLSGKGFELEALTHPNDIVSGEGAEMKLLMDGKPVTGAEVEITRSGTKYRNDRESLKLITKEDGLINFTPATAGPYMLTASLEQPSQSERADKEIAVLFMTFEAMAE